MEMYCESCEYIITLKSNHDIVQETCSRCGSRNIIINVNLEDQFIVDIKEKIEGKLDNPNYKKARVEFKHGDDYFRKGKKWNKLDRVIDRENDRYYEKIIDPDTGEIIRYCEEKLSEHQNRGSAKWKKN